jgi:hypothetical protein
LKQFLIAYLQHSGRVLAKLVDKDDSGEVTPIKIADFFKDIWSDGLTLDQLDQFSHYQ